MALDAGLPDHGLKKVPTYLTKAGSGNKRSSEEDGNSPKLSPKRPNRKDTAGSKDFNADNLTFKQRMALVCNNYNTGNCTRRNCSRAHACSYPMPDGKLCGQKHAMIDSH